MNYEICLPLTYLVRPRLKRQWQVEATHGVAKHRQSPKAGRRAERDPSLLIRMAAKRHTRKRKGRAAGVPFGSTARKKCEIIPQRAKTSHAQTPRRRSAKKTKQLFFAIFASLRLGVKLSVFSQLRLAVPQTRA
jgi:hypothetical protein